MTGKTSIEWATAVWNPTTGCTRVSAGCDNCYAFALHDKRYASNADAAASFLNTHDQDRLLNPAPKPKDLATWGRSNGVPMPWPKQYDLPFSRVQLLPDRLDDPLRHRKPERYFVDSMADLFHQDVPDAYIAEVWGVMARATQHTFLILTKRPERMRHWVADYAQFTEGLPNVWLGTSVEDQKAADERIPHLLATPAAVRFVSCEPLLGPVDLRRWIGVRVALDKAVILGEELGLHWVIAGGESGPRARPMDLAWARSLVEQCRRVGVAPFVKQLGAHPYDSETARGTPFGMIPTAARLKLRESHGRDMDEWPEDLRVRELPR